MFESNWLIIVVGSSDYQGEIAMSQYENYSQTAASYDTTRSAIGSEIWLGNLMSRFRKLTDIHILDAGCGTGNYTIELARHGAHVTAFDINEAMLAEARTKVKDAGLEQLVEFRSGQLLDLPFADASFDAVMFNQVLHHLEPLDEVGFTNHHQTINEAARVLRKDGAIMINTCSKAQIERGYWYYSLIPDARTRCLERTIGASELQSAMRAAGFDKISRTVPLDALLLGEANHNAEGPLDENWRAGDSFWAYANPVELAAALNNVRNMKAANSLEKFRGEHDDKRHHLGQTTFWSAVKS